MNIFLIGMPGSGKTTIARHLAKELNYTYVDLDGMVEKDAKMFIEDIFEKYGEEKFRELETSALKNLKNDHLVVSLGGGIVTKKVNKDYINGLTFYLDTDLEIIKERLKEDYQRPLLRNRSLEQLFEERYLKYQDFADVIISNNTNIEQTVLSIMNYLKKEEKI
jgi:shikimate kinase